jgi:hypothetical protein
MVAETTALHDYDERYIALFDRRPISLGTVLKYRRQRHSVSSLVNPHMMDAFTAHQGEGNNIPH